MRMSDKELDKALRAAFSGVKMRGVGRSLWPGVASVLLEERIRPRVPRWALAAACAVVSLAAGLDLGLSLGRAQAQGPRLVRVRVEAPEARLATLAGNPMSRDVEGWEGWVALAPGADGVEVSTW